MESAIEQAFGIFSPDINGPDPQEEALARRLQRKKKEETPFTRHILIVNYQPSKFFTVMQQEDDLRGLAKVMEFMRAISIVFIVIHVYWFCYSAFVGMGINIGVVDRILLNFQRTAGLFSNLLVTKVFAFIFLGLSCLGTKGVKNQKMTWRKIYAAFLGGIVLFFMNWWMLDLPVQYDSERYRIYADAHHRATFSCSCREYGSAVC